MNLDILPNTAEFGSSLAQAHPSQRIHLEAKQAKVCGRLRTVELARVTTGYVPAGSAMRLQPHDVFSVRWFDGRAYHGQSHKTEEAARAHFSTF